MDFNFNPNTAQAAQPFWQSAPRIDISEMLKTQPPELDFVIPGLLSGTIGALVSAGGTGKSALTLQIAASVATGIDLLGFAGENDWQPGTPSRVLFLTAEDPQEVLHHRIHALQDSIRRRLNDTRKAQKAMHDFAQNVEILPLVGMLPDLMNEQQTADLIPYTKDQKLIVVDTLRRFHRLPENDDGAMALLVGTLENIVQQSDSRPAILYLHHINKASSREGGGGEQTASRGSSVLVDNARFQMNLQTMTAAEAKKLNIQQDDRQLFVRLIRSKANYCPPLPDRWYIREAGGMLKPTELAVDHEEPAATDGYNTYEAAKSGDIMRPAKATRRETARGVNGGVW